MRRVLAGRIASLEDPRILERVQRAVVGIGEADLRLLHLFELTEMLSALGFSFSCFGDEAPLHRAAGRRRPGAPKRGQHGPTKWEALLELAKRRGLMDSPMAVGSFRSKVLRLRACFRRAGMTFFPPWEAMQTRWRAAFTRALTEELAARGASRRRVPRRDLDEAMAAARDAAAVTAALGPLGNQ